MSTPKSTLPAQPGAPSGETTDLNRNRRRRALGVRLGVLVFALALFATAWFVPLMSPDRDELTVVFTRGGGVLESADGSVSELTQGAGVRSGERVVVAPGGAVSLTAADGHTLTLSDSADLEVRGSRSTLLGGRVRATVDVTHGDLRVSGRGQSGTSLDIGLPSGVAGVRGTVVNLSVAGERAAVSVFEGAVGLSGTRGGKLDLTVGEGAVLSSEGAVAGIVPPAPTLNPLLAAYSVVHAPGTLLRWGRVSDAARYVVEFAADVFFVEGLFRGTTETTSIEIPLLEVEDSVFARVQAIGADGLVGFPSRPYAFVIDGNWARALEMREQGSAAGSLAEFEVARARFPENPYLLRDIGWTLYLIGRHEEARTVYERGRELAPTLDDMIVELGRVYFWLGAYAPAEEAYRSVLERSPNNVDALWGLGDLYRVLGRRAEALELVRRALAISPSHAYARATLQQLGGN